MSMISRTLFVELAAVESRFFFYRYPKIKQPIRIAKKKKNKRTNKKKAEKLSNLNLNLRNVLKLLHHIQHSHMLYLHFTPNAKINSIVTIAQNHKIILKSAYPRVGPAAIN